MKQMTLLLLLETFYLNMLFTYGNNIYFTFVAKYAYCAYKYISSMRV